MADLLCGTYYPSIDQKGRMSFPTKLREILGPEFFLCQGPDDAYIAVYSPEAFQEYCNKLNSIPGKQVVVIGANHRAEIWNKAKWEEFSGSISQEEINSVLADLVL